jgi:hypothetical protein
LTPTSDGRASTLRAALLAAAFLAVTAVGVWHHEMWRDEWQAWMLVRDSTTVSHLLDLLRYEGHFPGWHLILFVLSRFTRSPVAMQVAHVGLATGSVFLLARFSPFPWAFKVLCAFGYFFAFEYAVIARPYALGVLALFAFCAAYPSRARRSWFMALLLILLASTSVYGLILAAAAAGTLLLEAAWFPARGQRRAPWLTGARLGLAVWVGALAAAGLLALLRPPTYLVGVPGTSDLPLLSKWALASTLGALAQAYLPLPDLAAGLPWGSLTLSGHTTPGLAVLLVLAVSLVGATVLMLLRTPLALFFYLVGNAGLLLFGHLVFGGFLRHHGHFFVLLIACLWLAGRSPEWRRIPPVLDRWTGTDAPWARAFLAVILSVQLAAGGVLYAADLRRPFSAAEQVADFIRAQDLENLPIFASPSPPASSVAGALDRPIHYQGIGASGTFVRWTRYVRHRDRTFAMRLFRPFFDAQVTDVLVILGAPFDAWDTDLEVRELARFGPALASTERYVLYRVGRATPSVPVSILNADLPLADAVVLVHQAVEPAGRRAHDISVQDRRRAEHGRLAGGPVRGVGHGRRLAGPGVVRGVEAGERPPGLE